jgi:hypothetical protein
MENYFITESNSFNNGYNSTLGGEGTLGVKQTSSQIKKRTSSYGYKNRRIVAKSGIEHPSFGKKRPDASARMMSDNPAKKPEVIKKLKTFTGELSSAYDDTIYTFIHKDGTILRTTQYNLRTTFNLSSGSVSRMVRKTPRYKSVKGWSLL